MTADGTTPSETRQRGLAKMSEVYGWDFADGPGAHFAVTADHLFADIWSRPGLSVRDRRLLLLGAVTAQGHLDIAEIQIGAALRNEELSEEQLREIALFLCHYVGWPAGTKLDGAVGKVIAQERRKK
ncbi:carboxymuconolactone decarboxylase family protein [Nocardia neocaledoniensis]|uniref:4-carboxymuconolactone decarboxylase n=1 Tax=Nocardia neocaledoniensis TaxID=236511 RepID=A0A317N3U7_9NOCA|nr:carboxymuconolactone decarboxylase family protein [Nocardia neocaledoniensis]PWV69941.1 4-carboxymuconolactone decarboxylase [Nocardia neocaledoniensis]GEM31103.1 putative 4-carboxymuconolactone decarboxylase [Nocardia neocaledoniensis NBRC 108232]